MTGNVTIALLIGVLYTVGTYLLLQRTLTRVVIGLGLLGHGANLLALAYRSWLLTDEDEVQDDLEDARVMRFGREEEARRAAASATREPVEDDA